MTVFLVTVAIFAAAWTISLTYITVFYHRAFAHRSVALKPGVRRWVLHSGIWVTGMDPVGWVAMHRLHHVSADTSGDPHSPANVGVLGVAVAQLRSYERALIRVARRDPETLAMVEDIGDTISWLNRRGVWWLPYAVHAAVATVIAIWGLWPFGVAYWIGMMGHPIQGWAVNSLGHRFGYRRFDTPDRSTNNWLVATLVMGEGLQNNHHAYPASCKFNAKWWEPDLGFFAVRLLCTFHLVGYQASTIPDVLSSRTTPRRSGVERAGRGTTSRRGVP